VHLFDSLWQEDEKRMTRSSKLFARGDFLQLSTAVIKLFLSSAAKGSVEPVTSTATVTSVYSVAPRCSMRVDENRKACAPDPTFPWFIVSSIILAWDFSFDFLFLLFQQVI